MELDEQSLARLCSQRDRLAEDELYTRYAAKVYTLCRRYLCDDDKAKDLMQESFIQALDKIQTFKYSGQGSLYGWIRRIAINKSLN
ncbi:MAG: RNA polymerase subunit sigma, partial [Bacteroidales bacterium]|nr:RNA polymerase subunit sigma [Bacteroidales bacterium]